MSEIKVARYRNTPYYVNFISNGLTKPYHWAGSKNGKVDIKLIPIEVADWMTMSTASFRDGELVIVTEDNELAKEIVENIDDRDAYANNTHTKEDILKLLGGNINKMKAELNKITVDSEKRFVLDVAKEIKDDITLNKSEFLSEWSGVPTDILFD